MYGHPIGILGMVVPFVLEAMIIQPDGFEMYAMTLHGFLLGLLTFFFGFTCIHCGTSYWETVRKWRWMYLIIAVLLFLVRAGVFELKAPNYLMALESNMWIFTAFGFAYRYLNHPSKELKYLSQGAYPIYIMHMVILYAGAALIMPLVISTVIKFVLIVGFTAAGSFTFYEFVIRRVGFFRPLFGLKRVPVTIQNV
jgi:hypothetical protein